MWWLIIVLLLGFGGVYCALRLYINTLLFKEAKFQLILDKLQKETEILITEFNRVTDRNVTIVEENIIKLNTLIRQSKKHITHLSKKQPARPAQTYSPQSVAQNNIRPIKSDNTSVHAHIVRLLERGIRKEEIADQVGVSVSEVEMISVML